MDGSAINTFVNALPGWLLQLLAQQQQRKQHEETLAAGQTQFLKNYDLTKQHYDMQERQTKHLINLEELNRQKLDKLDEMQRQQAIENEAFRRDMQKLAIQNQQIQLDLAKAQSIINAYNAGIYYNPSTGKIEPVPSPSLHEKLVTESAKLEQQLATFSSMVGLPLNEFKMWLNGQVSIDDVANPEVRKKLKQFSKDKESIAAARAAYSQLISLGNLVDRYYTDVPSKIKTAFNVQTPLSLNFHKKAGMLQNTPPWFRPTESDLEVMGMMGQGGAINLDDLERIDEFLNR